MSGAEVFVQSAELVAAQEPFYTVPDWAHIEPARLRRLDGDAEVGPGVRAIAAPGHTPGHQAVAVDTAAGLALVAGQACYTCAEFGEAAPAGFDMHDESWLDTGLESAKRLRALDPVAAYFSHDAHTWERP